MRKLTPLAFAPFILFTLACYTEVDGERAADIAAGGDGCPEGEVCTDDTPDGLRFFGQGFYDEGGIMRLGPVLKGGTFELGFNAVSGRLGPVDVASDDSSILRAEVAPRTDGFAVDGNAIVHGMADGRATVRVIDDDGLLYDRMPIDVFEIDAVDVVNVGDPGRVELIAGCDEMLGIHLLANDGGTTLRAFDSSVRVTADGQSLSPETWAWDCFRTVIAPDMSAVNIRVFAGGETFVTELSVRPLDDDEICPEILTD